MADAPLGAIISYWMRPTNTRVHIHRIEVEHALYMAAATQSQIRTTLGNLVQQQAESLQGIQYALHELRDAVVFGMAGVEGAVTAVNETLTKGFYQLHLDAQAIHFTLNDILALLLDKQEFLKVLDRRRALQEARIAQLMAESTYNDAMSLAKRALNDGTLGKARAILDEAMLLFRRVSAHADFAIDANFQLGYLSHVHLGDADVAYQYFEQALGPTFSPHFIRTARYLAHLDYLSGRPAQALGRLQELVAFDEAVGAFAKDLLIVTGLLWDDNACIRGLEGALARHKTLLSQCSRLQEVETQFADTRRFTATERFLESAPTIIAELGQVRPEMRIYFEGARYAVQAGQLSLGVAWIRHCHDAQPTLGARRALLLEAMANADLRDA